LPLAGLILAQGGRPGSAALSIAGQSLVEYQARALRAVGAQHIVVMVDTLPAAMVSAFDRLRSEGLSIDTARTPQDAADRIHPDEALLLMSQGVIVSPDTLQRMAALADRGVATLEDGAETAQFERIDKDDRWAGVARLSGTDLRQTTAKLGEWDLGPTLLRVALQSGAARMRLASPEFAALVETEEQAASASALLATSGAAANTTPFARIVGASAARLGLMQAVKHSVPFDLVAVVAPALLLAALLLGWVGWSAVSFFVFALSGIAGQISVALGASAIRSSWAVEHLVLMRAAVFVLLLWLAAAVLVPLGWGIYVFAAWLSLEAVFGFEYDNPWRPGFDDLALVLGLSLIAGFPAIGFAIAIGWAIVPALVAKLKKPL
jgi:hypothetical protein